MRRVVWGAGLSWVAACSDSCGVHCAVSLLAPGAELVLAYNWFLQESLRWSCCCCWQCLWTAILLVTESKSHRLFPVVRTRFQTPSVTHKPGKAKEWRKFMQHWRVQKKNATYQRNLKTNRSQTRLNLGSKLLLQLLLKSAAHVSQQTKLHIPNRQY